jgi:hypothetical protein
MSVCLSVTFFLGGRQPAWLGTTIVKQWEPSVIVNLIVIVIPIVSHNVIVINSYCHCCSYWYLLSFLLLYYDPAFAGLDTPLPLLFQVRSSRPQDDRHCPRGALPPVGLGHFWRLHPMGTLPGNAPPTCSPNQDFLFNSWSITIQVLPQNASFIGAWAPAFPVPGAVTPGLSLLCLVHQFHEACFVRI